MILDPLDGLNDKSEITRRRERLEGDKQLERVVANMRMQLRLLQNLSSVPPGILQVAQLSKI